MWPLMICNAAIELGWIAGGVVLITKDHPVFGLVCLLMGWFSGYVTKSERSIE